ncbi:leucine-rich repeat protein SHOC-2-like, partial [Limulus polyphemus]|uniref:Leucine-rich repeat protein soc-2 homolog n=1 Tax=Limulus polyphemus TaxID=6850 RepID=A0ABM1RV10_LIMPO
MNLNTLLKDYEQNHLRDSSHVSNNCTLTLTSFDIKELPGVVLGFSCLVNLSLDHNELHSLPLDMCDRLMNLHRMSLNDNRVASLPRNLGNLKNLVELLARKNYLQELPISICQLVRLEKLNLSCNEIMCIPDNFNCLQNLRELYLDENNLQSLPDSFGHLRNLEVLEASKNVITELPETFGYLVKLRTLKLNDNNISELPNSFSYLPSLEDLDLSYNHLTTLPETLASAELIVKLVLDYNHICSLPVWFNCMTNVEELSTKGNNINGDPFLDDFSIKCSKLKHFDFSGNNIETLPSTFGFIKKVEFIDMGSHLFQLQQNRNLKNGNLLKSLPSGFGNLHHLTELHLDENHLECLPETFGNLKNLELLDLSNNILTHLPDSFCHLESLRICMLSINYLKFIPVNFGLLQCLEDLRLDNNQLLELPESFNNLQALKSLDLYNNKLIAFPLSLLNLTSLNKLDLEKNNFGLSVNELPNTSFKAPSDLTAPLLKHNWKADGIEFEAEERRMNGEVHESPYSLRRLESALAVGASLWYSNGQKRSRIKATSQAVNSRKVSFEEFTDRNENDEISS